MFFLDQSFDLTQALQLAKVQTTAENEAAVLAAAQTLGFAVDRSLLRGLVDLRTGRVTAFLRGSASMSTVLPLALLSAAQNPGHPLLALADEMPDLVEVIAFLKSQRGDELHQRTAAPKAEDPLPSPVGLWTRQLVGALMPSFRFDGDLEETSALSGSADDRLDARLEMQSEFGRSVFVGWPTDLQDNLLDAELAWLALGGRRNPGRWNVRQPTCDSGAECVQVRTWAGAVREPGGSRLRCVRVRAGVAARLRPVAGDV